jgi:N4-gp56 family major capsid protein
MADQFTGIAALDYDQAAFNKALWFAFREANVFDQVATIKPTSVTNPGATVTFFKQLDLAPVSATLNESVDVDAVALDSDVVTVSLFEKGNAVIDTALIRLTSMIPLDPAITNVLGFNAAESMDVLAKTKLFAGTNVDYSGAATNRATVTPATVLSSEDFRYARNRLRRAKVPKLNGKYTAFVHPDAVYDIRREAGGIGWNDVMRGGSEVGANRIFTDEIGDYEGIRVIETANAPILSNAGSSPATTDVYQTLFIGDRALAKGYSSAEGYGPNPITVMSPVVDKLRRFQGWAWKHFVGYELFETSAVWRVESGSSIGANLT